MRVAVIGGGFGGLVTALLLERSISDCEVVLLESSDRIGGRVSTGTLSDGSRYEAGAAELYDISGYRDIADLVHWLGLASQPMSATPRFVLGGKIVVDQKGVEEVLGEESIDDLRRFWARGTRMRPPSRYTHAGSPSDSMNPWANMSWKEVLDVELKTEPARRFVAVQGHCDVATEPEFTSGLFGFDNLLIDHPDYCKMFVLQDGNDSLIRAIRNKISAEAIRSPVRAVSLSGDGVLVKTDDMDISADFVICTPQPDAVRMIDWRGRLLREAVAGHLRRFDYPTTYLRVTILTKSRSWERVLPQDYFVTDAFNGTVVYDLSRMAVPGRGILSWLIAGEPASLMSLFSDEEIVAQVLANTPASLGITRGQIVDARVDRWVGAMGVSRLPGGWPIPSYDERHFPLGEDIRVSFCGDYLYDATLNGTLSAAQHIVERIAEEEDEELWAPPVTPSPFRRRPVVVPSFLSS